MLGTQWSATRLPGRATARPDVAAAFGAQFGMAGFHLGNATQPPGTYDLVVFARSSVVTAFNNSAVVRITVQ